ncbi:hypothetical protein ACSD4E_000182 [Escherichia coli]
MESNIKGLVAAGHEMASELKAECGAVDMRSVAKLISDLATQLEVQLVRANALSEDHQKAIESIKQADAAVKLAHEKFSALSAENAGLKAGHSYFSYGSEHNFEWHKTAEEAIESAEAAIDDYRGDACDGWSEEVDSICWGIIMQSSTKVGERPRNEDDCCDPAIDTICDYALLPNIDTPATDAFLSEVRAQCLNAFIQHHSAELDAHIKNGGEQFDEKSVRIRDIIVSARLFREQIRKGVQS